MGQYKKFVCDECGFQYNHDSEIFWIDDDSKLHTSLLTSISSDKKNNASVSGDYSQYFCYSCDNVVESFLITDNSSELNDEDILGIIEGYSDSLKIIKFGDEFQKCLECSNSLKHRSLKYFSLDSKDNFNISDEKPEFSDKSLKHDKFNGCYFGYYCKECKKQINKFIVKDKSPDLDENTIKSILKEHTNDLTILLFDYDAEVCPKCGGDAKLLDDFSICPKCKNGILLTHDVLDMG